MLGLREALHHLSSRLYACHQCTSFISTSNDGRVVRSGARTAEYLLHKLFGRSSCKHHCVFFGLLDVLAVKTASSHVQAAKPYMMSPFSILLSLCESGTRMLRRGLVGWIHGQRLFEDHHVVVATEAQQPDSQDSLLPLSCWFIGTLCFLHHTCPSEDSASACKTSIE